MTASILVVEDERTLGRALTVFLQDQGYDVTLATDVPQALAAIEASQPDVIFCDVRLPGASGLELLGAVRASGAATPLILMTAHGTIEGAVAAVKQGAFDYLKKPVDLEELKLLAERALTAQRTAGELAFYRHRAGDDGEVVGDAPAFREVLARARDLARLPDTPPVLITGETGTGKTALARVIHAASPRRERPFIDINCTALPASLAEAELFGHERGAFTDAKATRLGLFEAADGGFLFLDEIGDLDLAVQGKLLRAIEDRVVRRLGGTRDRTVDVRIVAATNRDLAAMAARDAFRRDLYYRIAVLTLHLPPLRARGDDVVRLAAHYLARAARRYGKPVRDLAPDAAPVLRAYAWPGNIRELGHVVERAVLWSGGPLVSGAELARAIGDAPARPAPMLPPEGVDLVAWERTLLERALRDADGNQTRAAQRLGISRDTLRYRMKKYGLSTG